MMLIDFADDIGVTIMPQYTKRIEILTNEAIGEFKSWLKGAGLELAELKIEVVLIEEHSKHSQPALKYSGVIIDQKLKATS